MRKNINPDKKKAKGTSGRGAKISRDNKGNIVADRSGNYGGVSNETLRQDRAVRARTGDGTYSGTPAPRVGGKATGKRLNVVGGTKKQIKASRRNVKKSAASPQAKLAAKRLYK